MQSVHQVTDMLHSFLQGAIVLGTTETLFKSTSGFLMFVHIHGVIHASIATAPTHTAFCGVQNTKRAIPFFQVWYAFSVQSVHSSNNFIMMNF